MEEGHISYRGLVH